VPASSIDQELCVGECVLPLNEIRTKDVYHIWLPLRPMSTDGKSAGVVNASPGALSVPSFGKLRLKLTWNATPDLTIGDLPPRMKWLLETDLLIANSSESSHRLSGKHVTIFSTFVYYFAGSDILYL
jgi:hypothetical protein